ncbi:MAG: biotin/lipoyl-binding protein [Anaerolineales bacterium]|nr:biotin/lipoyl-binding protein [Anaerolineales bacterium]MCL4261212.1 biotin/lipoyl-binding protein [Anaerolineales bacterium]
MKTNFEYLSANYVINLIPTGKSHRAAMGDKTVNVEILRAENGKLDLLIDGERVVAFISADGAKRWVTINGRTFMLTKQSGVRKRGGGGQQSAGGLTAPMPGQVRAVNVSEGESVTKGQTLLVLEAMKMEIRIQAPMDGVVKKLLVKQGQTVEREQTLITVE